MRTGTCDRCGDPFVDTSPAQRRRFCCDNCRKRTHDDGTYHQPCKGGCGRLAYTKGNSGYCTECSPILSAIRERKEARWRRIEAWWAEGLTVRQIAEKLGCPKNTFLYELGKMRNAGRDLPHRRTPEQCVRIREGRWAA